MTADTRRAVRRFILVAVLLPILIVLAGLVVIAVALPDLPDPVATHWGAGGAPDDFGPVWLPMVLLAICGIGLPVLLAILTLPGLRRGDHGMAYPFLAATALGLATLLTVLVTASTVRQAGLADAADGPMIWLPLAAGLAAGAAAGAAGWFLQPRRRFVPTAAAPATPAVLASGERVAWLQRVPIARGGRLLLIGALVLLAVMTVVTTLGSADTAAVWIMGAVTVLMALLVVSTLVFHVRVDEDGLTVTSAAGWPRTRVPIGDVATAAAVEVNPMAEFGGWGLRWGPGGRFGVVLRIGEGIEVTRRSGRTFVVTVDDAQTGASLLNALAARTETAR